MIRGTIPLDLIRPRIWDKADLPNLGAWILLKDLLPRPVPILASYKKPLDRRSAQDRVSERLFRRRDIRAKTYYSPSGRLRPSGWLRTCDDVRHHFCGG